MKGRAAMKISGEFLNWEQIIKRWGGGMPPEVLIPNARKIGEFLKQHQIPAFNEHQISKDLELKLSTDPEPLPWIQQLQYSVRGGMKVPHLHLADHIYLLNDKQWQEFSGMMLKSIKDKLDNTNKVNFDQLMTLASAAEKL